VHLSNKIYGLLDEHLDGRMIVIISSGVPASTAYMDDGWTHMNCLSLQHDSQHYYWTYQWS